MVATTKTPAQINPDNDRILHENILNCMKVLFQYFQNIVITNVDVNLPTTLLLTLMSMSIYKRSNKFQSKRVLQFVPLQYHARNNEIEITSQVHAKIFLTLEWTTPRQVKGGRSVVGVRPRAPNISAQRTLTVTAPVKHAGRTPPR